MPLTQWQVGGEDGELRAAAMFQSHLRQNSTQTQRWLVQVVRMGNGPHDADDEWLVKWL